MVRVFSQKVWYYCRRINGKLWKIRLGTYPAISLAEIRSKVRDTQCEIELGTFEKADATLQAKQTLGEIIPMFIELYCPSSYKMGHQSGLSFGGSGSFV